MTVAGDMHATRRGRRTSLWLTADLDAQVKASGAKLADLIRRGLAAPAAPGMPRGVASVDEWITAQQAAAALEITESRVHHLLAGGYLVSRKADDGWHRLVSAESVCAELGRRELLRQAARPPYLGAAIAYQAESVSQFQPREEVGE